MCRVVHFEIPAEDLGRARKFYRDVFDWKEKDYPDMEYVMLHTGPTGDDDMA